jgi:hypothetical protein
LDLLQQRINLLFELGLLLLNRHQWRLRLIDHRLGQLLLCALQPLHLVQHLGHQIVRLTELVLRHAGLGQQHLVLQLRDGRVGIVGHQPGGVADFAKPGGHLRQTGSQLRA